MRNVMLALCLAAGVGGALSAQDKMMTAGKKDQMAAPRTYSGCLETAAGGGFALTHVMAVPARDRKAGAMAHDGMKKDAGNDGGMAGAAMMKDGMKDGMKQGMHGDGMKKSDAMAPSMLTLMGSGLDAHVGHKVVVTGTSEAMGGQSHFAVTSITSTGTTCG
jgi:hypothetical protein